MVPVRYVADDTDSITHQDVFIINVKNDGEVIITTELLIENRLE